MKARKVIVALFLSVFIGALAAFAIARPVSAAADENIMRTVYNALLYRCYTGGYMNGVVVNENQDLWHENDDDSKNLFKMDVASEKNILLPNGWTNVPDDTLSCVELFAGNAGSFSGLRSMYGLPTENKALLDKLGYDLLVSGTGGGTKQTCFKPVFTLGTVLEVNSNGWLPGGWERQGGLTNTSISNGPEACFETDANGTITAKGVRGDSGSKHGDGGTLSYDLILDGNILEFVIDTSAARPAIDLEYRIGETKIGDLVSALQSRLTGQEINVTTNTRGADDPVTGQARRTRQVLVYNDVATSEKDSGSLTTGFYSFCNGNATCASNRAGQSIFGTSNRALSEGQVATIYLDYINRYTTYTCNENDTGIKKVRLKIGNEWKTCTISHASKDTFNGVDSNRMFGVPVTLDDIIDYLGRADYEDVDGLGRESNVGIVDPAPSDEDSSTGTDAVDDCYGSPGTLGMSWLLCPVLSGLSNTLNWTYHNIVEDYLVIEPGLTSDNKIYNAWTTFQTIANIIIVIFLLVVIFSQLTGFGIDNYGIKKILPRLIICAILINLSYFIVQALVDLSNIIGSGIANIFNISSINIDAADYSGINIPSHILGIGIATAFGAGVAAAIANPAILLSFLMVLLSGLFSVLLMWVILVARKAGVVVAVVLAPVAFALYLLPNTSKTTKSWINLVKGLLLLYPLAALLIGTSFFASELLRGLGDDFILPAMLLRVVPFFALPTLFRKSLDAVGNLGTKIQGFGRTLSRGATGAMRGADWYKNAQERGMERRTRIRAGLDQDGRDQRRGWNILRSRNDRARARYRAQYLKTQGEQDKANLLNDQQYMESMLAKQRFEAGEAGRDATKYTDAGYLEGKKAQGRLSRENEIEGARLYITPEFEASKASQYDESRQSELRKMFTEQNLSQGTTAEARRDRLSELLRGGLRGQNDAAEAEALMDLLKDKGDIRQLIDGLNGVSSAELGVMDAGLRSRIAGRALAAGNTLLKGWAKSVNAGNNINIDDYIARSGVGGLSNYIANDAGAHAFDNADKDTLEFLARHGGDTALSRDGAEAALASMSTTAANSSARASTAVSQMLNNIARRDLRNGTNVIGDIGSYVTAEDLSRMNNAIASSYGSSALSNAINEVNRPANSDLRAKMSNATKNTLNIVDPSQNPPAPTT